LKSFDSCRAEASAIQQLEIFLNNQDCLLRDHFDPRDIVDDKQARAILNRVYSMIINNISTRTEGISGTRSEFNFALNAEFDLFMYMILSNRPSLARLFWIRGGRKHTAVMFQNALLACLICRGLKELQVIKRHIHLVTAFEHVAEDYECFVADILEQAHARNEERTMSAINLDFNQCRGWNSVDVIVQAKCKRVVEACDKLCIDAVQRRFYGQSGLYSFFSRLALAWFNVVKELQSPPMTPKESKNLDRTYVSEFDTSESKSKSIPVAANQSERNLWSLLLCIFLDFAGTMQFFSPYLPQPLQTFWAPISAFTVYSLHGDSLMASLCLLEECFPVVHLIPSASLVCLYMQRTKSGGVVDDKHAVVYLPIDYFIIDALSHIVLTCVITSFILMEESALASTLEVIVIVLFLADEVPDILFAGVKKNSKSLLNVVSQGFKEYWGIVGSPHIFHFHNCLSYKK
jgi:hypothetical protein